MPGVTTIRPRHSPCWVASVTALAALRASIQKLVRCCCVGLFLEACSDGPHAARSEKPEVADVSSDGAASCHRDLTSAAPFDPSAPNEWPGPGVMHLSDTGDAINVSLDADGSVRQLTFGCDYWSCSSGLWAVDGAEVIVTPPAEKQDMAWPGSPRVTRIRLSLVAPGSVRAVVTSASPTPAQIWNFGRVCAECCGSLGPTDLYACPGPLEAQCANP